MLQPAARFDLVIGVPEGHARALAKPPSDGGFARTHHSDKYNGFVELPHAFAYTGRCAFAGCAGRTMLCCFSAYCRRFDTNSATKKGQFRMSARQRIAMGWKLLIGFVVVLFSWPVVWPGTVRSPDPRTHTVEQVIPDNKLPK